MQIGSSCQYQNNPGQGSRKTCHFSPQIKRMNSLHLLITVFLLGILDFSLLGKGWE